MSNRITHNHHIVPRHAGGSDEPANIIKLTVKEHAEAHKKLWEEHGRWQDYIAWQALEGSIGKDEIIFLKMSNGGKIGGSKNKGRKAHPNSVAAMKKAHKDGLIKYDNMKGKKHSEETKEKISISNTGKEKSDTHKFKLSIAQSKFLETNKHPLLGSKMSQETKDKISVAKKGKTSWNKGKKFINGQYV